MPVLERFPPAGDPADAGGPLTAAQIARRTCAAYKTISTKLHTLAGLGFFLRPRLKSGWYLTRQGWQVLFAGDNPPYPLPDGLIQADVADSAMETGEECPAPFHNCSEHNTPTCNATQLELADSAMETRQNHSVPRPDSSGETAPAATITYPNIADSGMNSSHHLADSSQKTTQIRDVALKKEETIKDSSLDSSSDSSSATQHSQAELLTPSHLLFGPPGVLPHGLPERPAQFVLGWLAQGYAQRRRLRVPAALVYQRLLKEDMPAAVYREHPERYLPPAFLAAVGLAPASYCITGDNAEDFPDNDASSDSEDEEETLPPDPSLLTQVNGRSILAAWEQAASRLRTELSPASYHTCLEPARPLCWQPPGRLVIAASTPYAREWLESRLLRLLERGLVGILAQPVEVVFIAMEGD